MSIKNKILFERQAQTCTNKKRGKYKNNKMNLHFNSFELHSHCLGLRLSRVLFCKLQPELQSLRKKFPVFGLKMEIYTVNFCIQTEYGEIQTKNLHVSLKKD